MSHVSVPACRGRRPGGHRLSRAALALLLLLAAVLPCWQAARADGPHLAFHGTSGAYSITLFSAPDPLVAGEGAFTLLIQRAADSAVLDRAQASGTLRLPGHPAIPLRFAPGGSANRQLPGATVRLADPGTYTLALQVEAAGYPAAHFAGALPVETNHGQRNTVLAAVFFPGVIVTLFLINQYARQQQRRARQRVSGVTSE